MSDDPVDAIMAVMQTAFDSRFGEAWTRRQVADALVSPSTHFLLFGQAEGEPLRAAQTTGFTMSRHVADEVELLLIAVRPDCRGQGLGRSIMQQFLADAYERGARKAFLEMRAGNPAEHLYRTCGFQQIGVRKGYYRGAVGGPIDAITFGRTI